MCKHSPSPPPSLVHQEPVSNFSSNQYPRRSSTFTVALFSRVVWYVASVLSTALFCFFFFLQLEKSCVKGVESGKKKEGRYFNGLLLSFVLPTGTNVHSRRMRIRIRMRLLNCSIKIYAKGEKKRNLHRFQKSVTSDRRNIPFGDLIRYR